MITPRNENCCKTIIIAALMIVAAIAVTHYGNTAMSWWIIGITAVTCLSIPFVQITTESNIDQKRLLISYVTVVGYMSAIFTANIISRWYGTNIGAAFLIGLTISAMVLFLISHANYQRAMTGWTPHVVLTILIISGNLLFFTGFEILTRGFRGMNSDELGMLAIFLHTYGFFTTILTAVVYVGFRERQFELLEGIEHDYKKAIARPIWMVLIPVAMIALIWVTPPIVFFGLTDSAERYLISFVGVVAFFGLWIGYGTCLIPNFNEDWAYSKSPRAAEHAEMLADIRKREADQDRIAAENAFIDMYDDVKT